MMIRLDEIRCPIPHSEEDFFLAVRRALTASEAGRTLLRIGFPALRIVKKSIDARKKPLLFEVFAVEAYSDETPPPLLSKSLLRKTAPAGVVCGSRPIVVGAGPSGLFAALTLAQGGLRPVLIERGSSVDQRVADIEKFWQKGVLRPDSNVQFGEGGAGTFSDGKLTTGIKDGNCRVVLETLVDAGAPEEILFAAKPHIGTDRLRGAVKAIREKIESLGGEVLFETRMESLLLDETQTVCGVNVRQGGQVLSIETDAVILAIGHSARDTIRALAAQGAAMQAKPFSMGVRIEHFQKNINESQYGRQTEEIETMLPAADYKLSCHLENGRDVYTFCMCPGGQVIACASGEGQVVTNGMSLHARDGENANSAVLVNVETADYPDASPLSGLEFQEKWERQAFLAGGGSYRAPAQVVGDFLRKTRKNEVIAISCACDTRVSPTYAPGVTWTELDDCLPAFVAESLRLALPVFDRKLKGFASPGAILTGIESRSSSPVRILRDSRKMSNIRGLYPCGEGAGYAGGIMSAAVDGIACAEACLEARKPGGIPH